MKQVKGYCIGILAMGFATSCYADIAALNKAANDLCEKSKVCITQEMAGNDDLPPGMEAMVTNMLDEMCKQYMSIGTVAGEYHEIIEPATACLNSMAAQSCDDLINGEIETAACERYEEVAEKYSQ